MTRSRPTTRAKVTMRSAIVSGCSTTAVVWAMTPGIRILPSGSLTSCQTRHSYEWRGGAAPPEEGLGLDPQQKVHDVPKAQIVDVRALPAAPAEVVAHSVLGDAGEGVIERVDVPGLHAPVVLERRLRNHHVPRFAEPGIVDLKDEPGIDDRSVLGAKGLGDREHVFFIGGVVAVLASSDHRLRDGGHEPLLDPAPVPPPL